MTRLHPFARLCLAAVGLFVAQVVAGLGLAAVFIVVKLLQSPGQSVNKIIGSLTSVTETNTLLLTLFVYPIGILWLGFCRAKLDKRSFISLGLRRPRLSSNLLRGALTGFLSIAVIWAILWLTGTISVNGWSQAARQPTVILSLLGWLIAFAAVGFFEEFVFRGYALHNLTNWLGWKGAVLVQALIFAAVHLANVAGASDAARVAALGAMPSIFLIAIFFALAYRKTGSLWFPIGFHAAWNFSLGCLFSLPVSGIKTFQLLNVQSNTQSWLSGGSFGAEGSFFLLPVLLALIWFILQAPDHPQALLDLELVQPELFSAPAPGAAPVVELENSAAEEPRENRYNTKFGTSEGFDSEMLRELRKLQQEREEKEAQARQERIAQQVPVEIELLKTPVVAAQESETNAATEVAATAEPSVVQPEVKTLIEKPEVEVVAVPIEKIEIIEPAETPAIETETAPLPVPAKKKSLPKW